MDLSNTQISGTGFKDLKSLTNIASLHLRRINITDEELAGLQAFPKLNWLSLDNTEVSLQGALEKLGSLPLLKTVHLQGTEAGRDGWALAKQQQTPEETVRPAAITLSHDKRASQKM